MEKFAALTLSGVRYRRKVRAGHRCSWHGADTGFTLVKKCFDVCRGAESSEEELGAVQGAATARWGARRGLALPATFDGVVIEDPCGFTFPPCRP